MFFVPYIYKTNLTVVLSCQNQLSLQYCTMLVQCYKNNDYGRKRQYTRDASNI